MSKLLQVENLTKVYFGFSAVDKVSFAIEKGTVVGLLGPNGAGKTTIMKMLVGLLEKTAGDIRYAEGVRVSYLQDVPEFYEFYSVKEYLGFVLELYHISTGTQEKIQRTMTRLGLADFADMRIKKLSRGLRQRLGVAAAIISDPELLILDEPVSAMDPMGRKDVFQLLGQLKGEMTIVFSSHVLTDVERICDHVLLLNKGSLILNSPMDDIQLDDNILSVRFFTPEDRETFLGAFTGGAEKTGETDLELVAGQVQQTECRVFDTLLKTGLSVGSVQVKRYSLEEVFIKEVERSEQLKNTL